MPQGQTYAALVVGMVLVCSTAFAMSMAHRHEETRCTVNTVLLVCERCLEVCGCAEPGLQSCAACVSHDCPLLPVPKKADMRCGTCAQLEQRGTGGAEVGHVPARRANWSAVVLGQARG